MSGPQTVQAADYIKAHTQFCPFLVLLEKRLKTNSIYDTLWVLPTHLAAGFLNMITFASKKRALIPSLDGFWSEEAEQLLNFLPRRNWTVRGGRPEE